MEEKDIKEPEGEKVSEDFEEAKLDTAEQNADPFGDYSAPKAVTPQKREKERGPAERKPSTKIAYAAAGTAIAIVSAVVTVYLPVKIMPLVLAAFCFFLVYRKCGIVYGIISAVATALVTFLCGGLSTSLLFLVVCFFPYSLICLALKKLSYRTVKGALIRAAVSIALVNITFVVVYFVAKYALLGGLDIMAAVGKMGYAVIAVLISVAAVITDILFTLCDKVITPKIK